MSSFLSSSSSSSRMLSLPLLLLNLILLCSRTAGEKSVKEAVIEPFSSSPPLSLSREAESESLWFFDSFLEAYRETVDAIVDLQTSNWNYIPRYKSFDESKVEGGCNAINSAHLSSSIPKFARHGFEAAGIESLTETKILRDQEKYGSKSSTKSTLPNGFQHDRETDIDRYLTQLAEGCSQDIEDNEIGANRYKTDCLDFLRNIVYEPRCTTRYDSRVKCNNETKFHNDNSAILSSSREVIEEHFRHDSLNIVIVGAGPIGLMLANALTMLQEEEDIIPPIRILILETRADAPGLKRPYTRNWQAHLALLHVSDHIVDPRLTKIFASMTEDKNDPESSTRGFVLPLNVIETLFLLSNRDLGAAKFLFGINPLELVDDLRDVPNLVLVDATGHRLEPLRRGTICDGNDNGSDSDSDSDSDNDCDITRDEDEKETIIRNFRTPAPPDLSWVNDDNTDFYDYVKTFQLDFSEDHDFLEEHGHDLHVGRTGDVMYPYDEKEEVAKSIYWLDIHGASLTHEQVIEDRHQMPDSLYTNGGAFCEWCEEWYEKQEADDFDELENENENENEDEEDIDAHCANLCYSNYFSQSIRLLRSDISRQIFQGRFNDSFVYGSDAWFPIMGYSFNPSSELAHQVQKVLDDHGYRGDPVGMPLRAFYPALERSIDLTQLSDIDLELVYALNRISSNSNSEKWPTLTVYTQRPFIYTNGVKKKKIPHRCDKDDSYTSIGDYLDDVPMIRFGDSFTTGDGLKGGGFYTHATMIGVFMDAIYEKAEQSYLPLLLSRLMLYEVAKKQAITHTNHILHWIKPIKEGGIARIQKWKRDMLVDDA